MDHESNMIKYSTKRYVEIEDKRMDFRNFTVAHIKIPESGREEIRSITTELQF